MNFLRIIWVPPWTSLDDCARTVPGPCQDPARTLPESSQFPQRSLPSPYKDPARSMTLNYLCSLAFKSHWKSSNFFCISSTCSKSSPTSAVCACCSLVFIQLVNSLASLTKTKALWVSSSLLVRSWYRVKTLSKVFSIWPCLAPTELLSNSCCCEAVSPEKWDKEF